MRFQDKVVVVTGAAGGLGAAICLAFAREGAKVVADDIGDLRPLCDEIAKLGGECLPVNGDVSKKADMIRLYEEAEKRFGGIDIVVANAGINTTQNSVAIVEEEEWDRVMNVNLKGVFFTCKYAIPYLEKRGGGAIVTMGSLVAKNGGFTSGGVYTATKGAIHSLTFALARELAPINVRVNSVAPGPIITPMTGIHSEASMKYMNDRIHMHRWGKPEEIAGPVLFLASDDASYITGEVLDVCGGAVTD
jgi:NAD(P)-dependent dehydrogenase (short-subunit alcohol dehydrogenase family)